MYVKIVKRSLASLAGLGVLVAGASLFTTRNAEARYCAANAFPPGNYEPAGKCALGCGGQLFRKISGVGPDTYCFIPSPGFGD